VKTRALKKKIRKAERSLNEDNRKLGSLKRKLPSEPLKDYELAGPSGPVKLSSLFGEKRDLIVVHNMGASCPYCTLWADGFNGLLPHLEDRAAFVVVSPDSPKNQAAFAKKRGWTFRMLSGRHGDFTDDMGFLSKEGPLPGVSTFRKSGRSIHRIASAPFGPFDSFCPAWPLFNLLSAGVGAWQPKFRY
jgi:predicted dithiol-disulfide oxidoreductase (DUF899 family)